MAEPLATFEKGDLIFELFKVGDRRYSGLRTDKFIFEVRCRRRNPVPHPVLLVNGLDLLEEVLREIVEWVRDDYYAGSEQQQQQQQQQGGAPPPLLRLSILSRHLDYPIGSPTLALDADSIVDYLLVCLVLALNSKQDIPLDSSFRIHATVADAPPLAVGARSRAVPASWNGADLVSSSNHLMLVPDFEGDLRDCCLLTAVALGLSHAAEMRALAGREKIPAAPATPMWRLFSRMGRKKEGPKAKRLLREHALSLVEEEGLDLEAFRLTDLERCRPELDKLRFNLCVYAEDVGFRKIFYHPFLFSPEWPTVHLLLLSNPVGGGLHCALIKDVGKFFHHRGTRECQFCRGVFTSRYFPFHRCSQRETCPFCRRVLRTEDDRVDFFTKKEFCSSRLRPDLRKLCTGCWREMTDLACHKVHQRYCKLNLEACHECRRVRRKTERDHVCGDRFCRNCRCYYDGMQKHTCQMRVPGGQKRYNRLVVWDSETVTGDGGEHIPNAVGASFETMFGTFSEVFFYDDDMAHPRDSVLAEDVFEYSYWPSDVSKERLVAQKNHKVPRNLKSPFFSAYVEERSAKRRRTGGSSFLTAEAQEVGADDDDDDGQWEDFEDGDDDLYSVLVGDRLECDADTAMGKFVDFFFNERFYGCSFVAHNSSRFDSLLLLRHLLARKLRVVPVFDGHKALLLEIPALKISVMDSYRYIRVALAKFGKRFPKVEVLAGGEKGVFPYRANTPDFYEHRGSVPAEDRFFDEFASDAAREKVRAFIRDFRGEWVFKDEIHKYLVQDVRVLRAGVVCLLEEFFNFQRELDPETLLPYHCFSPPFFTSSSFVHAVWRRFAMPKDSVYLVENQRNARQTSKHELEWLAFLNSKSEHKILTAFNNPGGQASFGRYLADGFCPESNTVYEFLGCAVHFHQPERRDCPKNLDLLPSSKNPFGRICSEVYGEWKFKEKNLLGRGLKVVAMWECEYERLREGDPDLKDFLAGYYADRPQERLTLRKALRGGRTEAFRLLFDQDAFPDRRLFYVDKNSLYPTVAIKYEYPVGKPETFIDEALDWVESRPGAGFFDKRDGGQLVGLVQLTVLPPDSLFLPVLPTTTGGKMKYGLCRTCLEQSLRGFCRHSDRERAITDVWTTAEVAFALECGYRTVRIHEMFVYRKTAPLFREFYTRLAKIKLESEGFPAGVDGPEARGAYVAALNEQMPSLDLRVEGVSENLARRQFAKDVSNIGLGKLSQNDNRRNVVFASSWMDISRIRGASDKELIDISPVTDCLAEVSYQVRDDRLGFHKNTQVVLYSFVTAYARLDMLRDMRRLQEMGCRVFYSDTDSVIFDCPSPADFVAGVDRQFSMGSKAYGAYKYETDSPLETFTTLGPKNYSFRTVAGQEVAKVRGLGLQNENARRVLNYAEMRDLLLDWLDGRSRFVLTRNFTMRTDRRTQSVRNRVAVKKYRNDGFDKRVVLGEGDARGECVDTYPFGTRSLKFSDICDEQ